MKILLDKIDRLLIKEGSDETNPDYMFQTIHSELLVKIAKKQLDAVELAKKELADRGFGKSGKWVGFDNAKKEWGVR